MILTPNKHVPRFVISLLWCSTLVSILEFASYSATLAKSVASGTFIVVVSKLKNRNEILYTSIPFIYSRVSF